MIAMKKIQLLLLLLIPLGLSSQSMRKYVLMEHFTNTNCPICSSNNPGIYAAVNNYPDDVHHIAIHPSVPYSDCALYQFNTEDNGARQSFYGVGGTPQVYLDGEFVSRTTSAIEQEIEAKLAESAGIQIAVEEGSARQRTINVTIASEIDYPEGDYKLFVAILEDNVAYTGRNGENEHFDVLRDYLTAPDGDDIDLPAAGEQLNLTFETDIDDAIVLEEAYTLVYIQNVSTREILNSGTMADGTTINNRDFAIKSGLQTFPNPVRDALRVSVDSQYEMHSYEVYNAMGQVVRQLDLQNPVSQLDIDTAELPRGTYWIKVGLEEGFSSSSFVKQ